MLRAREGWSDRARSVAGVAAIHAAVGYLLIADAGGTRLVEPERPLKLFDIVEPPPPPPIEEPVLAATEPEPEEGAAAPPGLKAQASPVVAPLPKVRLPVPPPPVVAATVGGLGAATSAGASEISGPGPGAGGIGSGTGSGRSGLGAGGGGAVTRARLVSGRMVNRDYPDAAGDAGAEGTVVVRFTVGTDGRASGCRVTRSSGNADLDATTCRLVEQRFRYTPARDASDRPVADVAGWSQDWWIGDRRRR